MYIWAATALSLLLLIHPLTSSVEKTRKRNRESRIRRQPDYPSYQKYVAALSEHHFQAEMRQHRKRQELEAAQKERLEKEKAREDWWKKLDGVTFELELAKLLTKKGYSVQRTGRSGDHGVDLQLELANKKVIVQCKAQKGQVGPGAARDLFGTLTHFKADEAWLVSTGGFSRACTDFVRGKPIRLLTIQELLQGHQHP